MESTELPFACRSPVRGSDCSEVYASSPSVTFNEILVRLNDRESDTRGGVKIRELS